MIAISNCLFHRWPRFRAALRPFNTRPKTFVVGVEVEEKLLRVNLISGFIGLQQRFKEPRGVTDVPAWWAHELCRLDYIVFYLQRRNDFHAARAHLLVQRDD